MSQLGRNDPCPCGSGKKQKKCCSMPKKAKELASRVSLQQGSLSLFTKYIEKSALSATAILEKANRFDASVSKQ